MHQSFHYIALMSTSGTGSKIQQHPSVRGPGVPFRFHVCELLLYLHIQERYLSVCLFFRRKLYIGMEFIDVLKDEVHIASLSCSYHIIHLSAKNLAVSICSTTVHAFFAEPVFILKVIDVTIPWAGTVRMTTRIAGITQNASSIFYPVSYTHLTLPTTPYV